MDDKGKKILCCLAVLLKLARTGGSVSNVPRLRNWSNKIVDYAGTLDSEVIAIEAVNGKKGIIAIAEGLTDAIGRLLVIEGADIPDTIFNGWVKAVDAVLHPENE